MNILVTVFFLSLLAGQLGGISLSPGVVIYLHDLVLVVLFVTMLIHLLRKKFVRPKLLLPISLFVGWAGISLILNSSRFTFFELGASSLYLVRWVAYAGLYVFVIQNVAPKFKWLMALYAVGVGFAILGLLQFFLYPSLANLIYLGWDPHFYRVFSTLLDPNFMGIIFVLTILLGISFWKQKNLRNVIILSEVIAFIALLLTYSRSSYLAFIAALVTLTVLKKQWKLMIGVVCFAGLIIFLPKANETLSLTRIDSTLARIGNWQSTIDLIAQSPVIGYGFNTLRYMTLFPQAEFISKSAAGVDSSILFVLATTGLTGLVLYGYMILMMIRRGKRLQWYEASFVALLVHSVFVNSAFYPWVLIWFWVVVGAVEKES